MQVAFDNVYQMLRRGGLLLLTVPYGLQPETIEHFPELHEFTLVERDGGCELHNLTKSGVRQTGVPRRTRSNSGNADILLL